MACVGMIMSLKTIIPLTLFGQYISGLAIPIGASVEFDIQCQDPATRAALDMTGRVLVASLASPDLRGDPKQPAIFSRSAIAGVGVGAQVLTWAPSDTVPAGVPLVAGTYLMDCWITDGATGDRLQIMGAVEIELLPTATLPSSTVTPLPPQTPLAGLYFIVTVLPDPTVASTNTLYILNGLLPGLFITFDNISWTAL